MRDCCSVVPRPKSEMRRRLDEILSLLKTQIKDEVGKMKRDPKHWGYPRDRTDEKELAQNDVLDSVINLDILK